VFRRSIVLQKKTLTAHARATGPAGGHPCSKVNINRYHIILYYYCYRCYYNNLRGNFRLIPRRRSSHLRLGCCCLSGTSVHSFRLCVSRLYNIIYLHALSAVVFAFVSAQYDFRKKKEISPLS